MRRQRTNNDERQLFESIISIENKFVIIGQFMAFLSFLSFVCYCSVWKEHQTSKSHTFCSIWTKKSPRGGAKEQKIEITMSLIFRFHSKSTTMLISFVFLIKVFDYLPLTWLLYVVICRVFFFWWIGNDTNDKMKIWNEWEI